MFKHKIDPLVQTELDRLTAETKNIGEGLAAVEEKLDEILQRLDSPERSIPGDGKQPKEPPLEIAPGHKPWSQRKREREQRTRDPRFAERVIAGAAPKEAGEEST